MQSRAWSAADTCPHPDYCWGEEHCKIRAGLSFSSKCRKTCYLLLFFFFKVFTQYWHTTLSCTLFLCRADFGWILFGNSKWAISREDWGQRSLRESQPYFLLISSKSAHQPSSEPCCPPNPPPSPLTVHLIAGAYYAHTLWSTACCNCCMSAHSATVRPSWELFRIRQLHSRMSFSRNTN